MLAVLGEEGHGMSRNRVLVAAAAAMALAAPMAGAEVAINPRPSGPEPTLGSWGKPGKGKGRRPHHISRRFVAMDKREARKARNRRGR